MLLFEFDPGFFKSANFFDVRITHSGYFAPFLPQTSEYGPVILLFTFASSLFDVRKARPGYFTPYPMLLCEYALGYYFFCKLVRCTKSSRPGHFTPYPMLLCEHALSYYFCKLVRRTTSSPRALYILIPSYYVSLLWGFTERCKLYENLLKALQCRKFPTTCSKGSND